jgi:hypothetical protein
MLASGAASGGGVVASIVTSVPTGTSTPVSRTVTSIDGGTASARASLAPSLTGTSVVRGASLTILSELGVDPSLGAPSGGVGLPSVDGVPPSGRASPSSSE